MGTRNLTMVVLDGEPKVAQYGQWDGYPGGQGLTVLKFCRKLANNNKRMSLDKFREKVRRCHWITPEEQAEFEAHYEANSNFNGWPQMTRDTAAEILQVIASSRSKKGVPLVDERDFARDSCFCEWAYVVNLDTEELECYKGFNKEPVPEGERFAGLTFKNCLSGEEDGGRGYYPVKLAKTYSIWDLPSDKEFCETLDPREDDE